MDRPAAAVAVLLVAVFVALVDYSVDLKPYIVDAALVPAVHLVARTLSPPTILGRQWWVHGVGGLLVILSPYAAPWAPSLRGGGVLCWRGWVERWPRERLMGMAMLGSLLATAFAAVYVTLYSPASANPLLQ